MVREYFSAKPGESISETQAPLCLKVACVVDAHWCTLYALTSLGADFVQASHSQFFYGMSLISPTVLILRRTGEKGREAIHRRSLARPK